MFLPSSFGMLPIAPLDPVDESLWYPVNPAQAYLSDVATVSSVGVNLGVLFTSVTGDLHSLCYYRVDPIISGSGKMALWQISDFTDVKLAEINFSGHTGTGWRTLPLTEPIRVLASRAYLAHLWLPAVGGLIHASDTANFYGDRGHYSEPYGFLYAVISNGQLDTRGFHRRNGFITEGAFARPVGNYSHNNYWIDVILNARPKPIPPTPPLTLKWPIPEGYPNASNTGCAPGTVFTVEMDPVNSSADGQIIENLDCRAGVQVKHSNVTVRNCKIRAPLYVVYIYEGTDNTLIEDCEIDGIGRNNINAAGVFFNTGATNVVIQRNNMYRIENGIAFAGGSGPILIKDNFIHNLRAGPGSPHYDGMQMDGVNHNTTVEHNTIYNENGDTSCIMIDNGNGGTDNILITDNYCGGGGYTFYIDERFHMDGSAPITNVRYIRNLIRPGKYGYYAISLVDVDNFPVRQGNRYAAHGNIFDSPPPGGFVGGQTVEEDFFGAPFDVPATVIGEDVTEEVGGITVGMAFTVTQVGQIGSINFFRPNFSSTTTVKIGLWRWLGSDRTQGTELLHSQTYEDVLETVCVNFPFTTPIAVNANDNLLVAVFIPRGTDGKCWHMSKFGFFWPNSVPSQWERMIAFSNNPAQIVNGFTSCNGLYAYGLDLTVPTNITDSDTNYYVDPVFSGIWPTDVTAAQTTNEASQNFIAALGPPFRVVDGAQTTNAATQAFAASLNRFVTGAQTTSPPTQAFSVAHAVRNVTGAQVTLKATQAFSVAHANKTVTGAQTTLKPTQVFIVGFAPTGYPDATNTGHTKAPGYPGSLTTFSGTLMSGTTYSFYDFPNDLDIGPDVTSITFVGCRFQSNARGDDSSAGGGNTRPWNVAIFGGSVTFSYCTFCPKVSIVTGPPNAAWPAAGTATAAWGGDGGGYAPYQIGPNDGYQFAVACYGTGAVTINGCDIWGFGNAIDCNPDTLGAAITITNTWMHDAANSESQPNRDSGYHTDGPGYLNGGTAPKNILVRNCTIASLGNTNAIAFQAASSAYAFIEVDGCYLSGFGITVDMCHNRAGNNNIKFTNNIISTAVRWIHQPMRGDNLAQFGSSFPTNQWFNNILRVWPGTTPSPDSSLSFTSGDDGKFIYPNNTLSTTDFVDGHP